jgi:enolase
MIINEVFAKSINDSRGEKTIEVEIKTDVGNFKASSPTGKSTGKYESKSYKKSLEKDIETLEKFKNYFSEEVIENFEDLRRIEDIVEGHIGANTLFALESATLKAVAKEQKKEVWQLINPAAKNFPRLVGNCIGGGKHSSPIGDRKKKPDFQEFLLIPKENSPTKAWEKNIETKKEVESILKKSDEYFKSKKNDENAWMVSLNEKEVLDVLAKVKIDLGVDVAASSFYKRKKYNYENPQLKRTFDEQIIYLSNLIKNYPLIYIEDPFGEEEFEEFAQLLEKFPDRMIVGDDLTVTNVKRLKKAIKMKSVNALIVKPNQNGSLLEVKKVCELAKENNIKIIFSHRSGETKENILADLAFGFSADFLKCGIDGIEREVKINRLIEIEKSFK